jgi:hypothetical protein
MKVVGTAGGGGLKAAAGCAGLLKPAAAADTGVVCGMWIGAASTGAGAGVWCWVSMNPIINSDNDPRPQGQLLGCA